MEPPSPQMYPRRECESAELIPQVKTVYSSLEADEKTPGNKRGFLSYVLSSSGKATRLRIK